MKKEEKNVIIDKLAELLKENANFYLADISELNAEKTSALRRKCFEREVTLTVVKNTLLQKEKEKNGFAETAIFEALKGSTALMFTAGAANVPAKVIKEFRASNDKPVLKAAYVQESLYVGDNMLEDLVNIKSRDELIGEIVMLLQSPAKNVLSALQSAGGKLAGLCKTLEERAAA
jgi:large subunit ribosomal protein L10